jgi:uncharacterized protein YecE (DUF72 family)
VEVYVGTSGYSYAEWKGSFYPEDLSAGKMLGYYGARLDAVEINNTFYRLPNAPVLEAWASQVPDSFRFSVKASRRITHFARLGEGAREPTEYLLSALAVLGPKLGAILFQVPPNLAADAGLLAAFLEALPEGTPCAFEFRHESWKAPAVRKLLEARGLALVCADTEESEGDEQIVPTARWGYIRLRRPDYKDEDLARWARRVRATGWERAYVFFKHEGEGTGPRLAGRFRKFAGG